MNLIDQFNDYVKWCRMKDDPPFETGVGTFQKKHGLRAALKWTPTDGMKLPGDPGSNIFFDIGKTETVMVDFGPPFGQLPLPIVVSLRAGGYFQQAPGNSSGIPFDSFNLELLIPGKNDAVFNLLVKTIDFIDGDKVDGIVKLKPTPNKIDTLTGIAKTKKGRKLSVTLDLIKGIEEQRV